MTPLQQYQMDIDNGYILADEKQHAIMLRLQRLSQQFDKTDNNLLAKIHKWLRRKKPVKGLYIWGSVGVGKTYLMDVFYQTLPSRRKLRVHFHRFMQQVHDDLKRLQGKADPLKIIAREFSLHADVLCFDEFFVNDITDVMLLAGLFDALFARGIVLVATSNVPPDELYRNGLQRERFLPAIDLLKQHTDVLHLDGDTDYRLRALENDGVYFMPLNSDTEAAMLGCFNDLTHHMPADTSPLLIDGRDIAVIGQASEVAWFEFDSICSVPRSQMDYLEIAQLFTTVFISNIPAINADENDKITYLINLIDVFYDNRVNVIISAAVPIEDIYRQGRKLFEFQRTQSRLQEMQSKEYIHRAHSQ